MKHFLSILSLLFVALTAVGQNLHLSFMSQSDAKFFVYVNGQRFNEQSSGHVTLNNLEDKIYHIRIEIDDPYQVSWTKEMRPSDTKGDYLVSFNTVRERVYVTPAKQGREDEGYESHSVSPKPKAPASVQDKGPRERPAFNMKKEDKNVTGTTGKGVNKVRTQMIEE